MHSLKHSLPVLFALLTLRAGTAFADPINFINGNFETGDFTGYTLSPGASFTFVSNTTTPADSSYAVFQGSVGTDSSFSQTFSDTAGANVTLSFDLLSDGSFTNDFSASVDGNTLFSVSNLPDQDFTTYTVNFIATGRDTVSFAARNDPGYLQLDNISLDQTPAFARNVEIAATPEPASLILLGTGMLGLFTRRRDSTR